MPETPVLSVTIIDTSVSMSYEGYVSITVIDSKAFVSSALAGDTLGVVNYDTNGYTAFPFTVVDSGTTVITAAANAIQELSFNGNCTNMGGGILQGRTMLDPVTGQRGMVLLSDGYQNCGTNPLSVLPSGYPIFSCAMGPDSDQNLMQQIASGTTNGAYYYAPYVYQMSQIYNQIRTQDPQSAMVANQYKSVTPLNYMLVPATISGSDQLAQISVTWTDTTYTYTSSSNPSSTQLSITLVNPSGQVITTAPTVVGLGYVVFNLDNPQSGTWYVQIEYGGTSTNLGVTAGVIEYQYAPSTEVAENPAAAQVAFTVQAPATASANQAFTVDARLTQGGQPISGQIVKLEVERPVLSLADTLALYKPQLANVVPDEAEIDRGVPEDVARLAALKRRLGDRVDLTPHRRFPLACQEVAPGVYRATVPPGAAGSANLRFRACGHSTLTQRPFSRAHLASVLVS